MKRRYLTSAEAAERLRLSVRTLANYRSRKIGPTWVKRGGRVLYPEDEVERYLGDLTAPSAETDSGAANLFSKFRSELPRRARTAIDNSGITRFDQLDPQLFRRIPNCGERTIATIMNAARSYMASGHGASSLDDEISRLVKAYGLKRVLSSAAEHTQS